MRKSKYILLAILTLFLASCATQRRCMYKHPIQSLRDSVYIETVHNIPVYLPGDTIKIESKIIDCPDQTILKFENDKLKQDVRILNGKLISKITIKPDTIFVPVIETQTLVHEIKVPQPVKFIPKVYKLSFWLVLTELFLLVGFIALRIFKPKWL